MAPDWFSQAIRHRPESHFFRVAGTRCHYLHWANPGKPALLLVHGHAAHAHWWDFIAPAFTEDYDVVAVDLSGCGDSDHRPQYAARTFAAELAACIRHADLVSPVVIGHSFGGAMARTACHLYPDQFHALVLVDSLVHAAKGARQPPPMPRKKTHYYASLEEGMRRFRLRPPQPCANDFILSHIAAHSLRSTPEGFTFKVDSALFAKMPGDDSLPAGSEMIEALTIPAACIYGDQSRFFPPQAVSMTEDLFGSDRVVQVRQAHHHVFLDQPLAFISALEKLLRSFAQ